LKVSDQGPGESLVELVGKQKKKEKYKEGMKTGRSRDLPWMYNTYSEFQKTKATSCSKTIKDATAIEQHTFRLIRREKSRKNQAYPQISLRKKERSTKEHPHIPAGKKDATGENAKTQSKAGILEGGAEKRGRGHARNRWFPAQ